VITRAARLGVLDIWMSLSSGTNSGMTYFCKARFNAVEPGFNSTSSLGGGDVGAVVLDTRQKKQAALRPCEAGQTWEEL
jgi:hypothetical protein